MIVVKVFLSVYEMALGVPNEVPAECRLPSKTLSTSVLYDSNLKGVKKPREPRWNAITGGTLPWTKRRLR